MQGLVLFRRHQLLAGQMFAVFSDPNGGPDVFLDFEECQDRLGELRNNNLPYEETERALIKWLEFAD